MIVILKGVLFIAFASIALAQNATNISSIIPLNINSSIPFIGYPVTTFNGTAQNVTRVNATVPEGNFTLKVSYEVTTATLDAVRLNLTDLSAIKNDTKLVIIVPCLEKSVSSAYNKLVTAYKNAGNYTIVKMNWTDTTNNTMSLEKKAKKAGKKLAMFIKELQKNGVKESNIHLIGSDVGVRVASVAAKLIPTNSSGRIGRFTALNPPGKSLWSKVISFFKDDDNSDLKATDVDLLDTLRTMNGYASTGGVDFYANKGRDQPGCYEEKSCYLERGVELMAESVQSKKLLAHKCTYGFFRGWVCLNKNSTVFGENMSSGIFEGTYNFFTKSVPPYALE